MAKLVSHGAEGALLPTRSFWHGRRVFVTGHTGFKGSWLSLWLQTLGAKVTGYALAPTTSPSLFTAARVERGMHSIIGDIRDADALAAALQTASPEIVLHLAAQPLVLESYRDPVGTYATNVMGTVHLLDAVRRTPSVRAVVNVTTDKCYANRESLWGYRETDALGGDDPYSSSKACAELVTAALRHAFLGPQGVAVATARAGNVIGGGDWSADRLLPDLLAAFSAGAPARLRRPEATRPWQHVLDPLAGYLLLAERLLTERDAFSTAWNFGPLDGAARSVAWMADRACAAWGTGASWFTERVDAAPHETTWLALDSTLAARRLGWSPRLDTGAAVDWTVAWQRAFIGGHDARQSTLAQIHTYVDGAHEASMPTLISA